MTAIVQRGSPAAYIRMADFRFTPFLIELLRVQLIDAQG